SKRDWSSDVCSSDLEDEIGRKVGEFGGKGGQTLAVSSSKSVFEDDVGALDPAEFAHFLSERRMIDGRSIQRRKMSNPVDLPRFILLRLSERPQESPNRQPTDEMRGGSALDDLVGSHQERLGDR